MSSHRKKSRKKTEVEHGSSNGTRRRSRSLEAGQDQNHEVRATNNQNNLKLSLKYPTTYCLKSLEY